MRAKESFLIAVLVLSFGVSAHAVEPIKPCAVPAGLAGPDRQRLTARYRKLNRRRRGLVARISAHNAKCRGLRSDQPARIARCEAARQPIEKEWADYEVKVKAYQAAQSRAIGNHRRTIESELTTLEKRIKRTKRQLLAYSKNPEQFEADLEDWANLAAGARKEALRAAKEAVVSVTLQHLSIQNQAAIELTEEQRRSVRKLLRSYGPILEYARKFSAQRLAALKTDAAIVKNLSDIKTAADLSTSVYLDPEDRDELLTAIAGILGVFVKDPRLGLIMTDVGIVTAAALGWTKGAISHARVKQLLALSEDMLRAVEVLSRLYRNDVDKRKALRRQMSALRTKVSGC
ncbi:MAG: hypothetical protein ACE5JS_02565 [Nitrospinota bacterium]